MATDLKADLLEEIALEGLDGRSFEWSRKTFMSQSLWLVFKSTSHLLPTPATGTPTADEK